ncbi:hypothetical protein [Legionella shakespearei]|uniref:Transmembrane protein n=1 Tax=Legionella shakespearei DSM 23087 TaxID=1122169 RepID=A0A0W0YV39_9GAMM|nr:hypothetical protein [Legionella shakespearei]KTD60757.1 hypothetical protein Lsha_1474 [Legionella shakespearei DSM 23087]
MEKKNSESNKTERGLVKKLAGAALGSIAGSASGVVEGGILLTNGPLHECEDEGTNLLAHGVGEQLLTIGGTPLWALILLGAAVYSYPKSCGKAGWKEGVDGIKENLRVSEVTSSFFRPSHMGERADFAEQHRFVEDLPSLNNGMKNNFIGKGWGF